LQRRLLTPRCRFVLTASLLALACSSDPEAGFGIERAPIVNGEPSDEMDDKVVQIITRTSDTHAAGCTAMLIAPDVIVTALHCVSYRENPTGTFTCRADGSIVPDSDRAGSLGAPTAGENVQVHVGAMPDQEPDAIGVRVFGSGATQICRGDLAAVVLDRELTQDFTMVRFGRSVSVGESLVAIGYGTTESPEIQGRRRRTVEVLDVGDYQGIDGTGPTPPDTFVVGQGPCFGDSGGPALSAETGAIVGVYSLSLAPMCTSIGARNTLTLVPAFEDTGRRALEFANREPLLEPDTGTGGTSGRGGSGGTGAQGEGSGSREDPSCACRTGGRHQNVLSGALGVALALLAVARRRPRGRMHRDARPHP
jgi:hypothetical protein